MYVNDGSAGTVEQLQGAVSGQASGQFVITLQPPFSEPMAVWLARSVAGSNPSSRGKIELADPNLTILDEWLWDNGTVTTIGLPALSASSADAVHITLNMQADAKYQAGNGAKLATGAGSRVVALDRNFALQIDGLPTQRVASVGAYTITPHGACKPLTVTIDASDLPAWEAANRNTPRTGKLELLTSDNQHVVFALSWTGLHITNMTLPTASGSNISRFTATFGCGQVAISDFMRWTTG